MKTVGLISLGCPKNLVDSEVMLGLLEKAGYLIVQNPASADVLVVNTCGFIEDAKKESVDAVLEMAGYKQRETGRCRRLVVAGCLPQRYKGEIAELFPEVDLFVGTGEYHNIVELLEKERGHQAVNPPRYIHSFQTPRKLSTPKHSVYVKIAEGCFHGCSFCIIPKIRGGFRCRTMKDIFNEAKMLIEGGSRELNLIAQDTTSYGKDLKDGSNLAKLLNKLSAIRGDFWLRVMYAYPTSITDEFIETVASNGKICKYLDIPLQHVSDKILKAMRRKERSRDIRKLIEKLRNRIPELAIRTSLIVGFPGEGKEEFEELLSFVKEGHFNHLGVFEYSQEEGTPSAKFAEQVSSKAKDGRRRKLMEIQAAISREKNNRQLGKKVKVLVEAEGRGRTMGQAPEIDGVTFIKNGECRVGEFADVKITHAGDYDLEGDIC